MDLPKTIRKLDPVVVNRIAAGEVIQRPANALKEMLENSLDAKATRISVVLGQGGLKLLQITDNGTGIRKDDLRIVCERFTTSKLANFEDLATISTYGFRGEALASITHVARLSLLTKTADSSCGYKVSYVDGKPQGEPEPVAANQGTTITVTDLFYNVPTRKRALKSGSEEFHRVADVVSKYAIHNAGVGFSLKKEGDSQLYVRTVKENSPSDNIAAIYGHVVSKELLNVSRDESAGHLGIKIKGLISNVNYNQKKLAFLLFINHRLVESSTIKKALEMVYLGYLPKGMHPFVYLSLEIDPRNVDVNVHPTKHEVQFLHQTEIVELIQQTVDAELLGSNKSRMFYANATVPAAMPVTLSELEKEHAKKKAHIQQISASSSNKTAYDPRHLVRTDAQEQKLDKFLTIEPKRRKQEGENEETRHLTEAMEVDTPLSVDSTASSTNISSGKPETMTQTETSVAKREIRLRSVKILRQEIDNKSHEALRALVKDHHFVGVVNANFALWQHQTKLYLVHTSSITQHLFYQILITNFGNFDAFQLDPAPRISELAKIALESKASNWNDEDGDINEAAKFIETSLMEKSEMLDDYFSMEICPETGRLKTLPVLLGNFVPCLDGLPIYIMRLASEVVWDEELPCFRTFCTETAKFYAIQKDHLEPRYDLHQHSDNEQTDPEKWKEVIQHIVFPAVKRLLLPPKTAADDMTFVQVANLPDLYKVFERC